MLSYPTARSVLHCFAVCVSRDMSNGLRHVAASFVYTRSYNKLTFKSQQIGRDNVAKAELANIQDL